MCERGVLGGALNLISTGYPDHGRFGDLPLQGKIPTAEPGIEPGTSWLVVRSSDQQATRLVVSLVLSNFNYLDVQINPVERHCFFHRNLWWYVERGV
jgi:hypothetical protein